MLNYSWKAGPKTPNRWGRPEFNATFSIGFWNVLMYLCMYLYLCVRIGAYLVVACMYLHVLHILFLNDTVTKDRSHVLKTPTPSRGAANGGLHSGYLQETYPVRRSHSEYPGQTSFGTSR